LDKKKISGLNLIMKKFFLTIDVETDWGGRLASQSGNNEGLEKGLPLILNFLKKNNIRATFFVSTILLKNWKDNILEIQRQGHEIASHGLRHNIDYSALTRDELKMEIEESKNLFDKIGVKISGFRTPQLRLNNRLFKILRELNFQYDSSVAFTKLPGRYDNISKKFDYQGIKEVPISVLPILKIPFGLLWINAFGFSLAKFFLKKMIKQEIIVMYFHPFDILPKKSRHQEFNFIVRSWYNFRKKKVLKTLQKTVDFFKEQNYVFEKIEDFLN
jgi:peptidoglycan/xylan/chitin deacetylase (PgdA/CDA1 family)